MTNLKEVSESNFLTALQAAGESYWLSIKSVTELHWQDPFTCKWHCPPLREICSVDLSLRISLSVACSVFISAVTGALFVKHLETHSTLYIARERVQEHGSDLLRVTVFVLN